MKGRNSFGFYRCWPGIPGHTFLDLLFRTKETIAYQLNNGIDTFDVCLRFDRSNYPYPRPVHPRFKYDFYDREYSQGWFEEFCESVKSFNQCYESVMHRLPKIYLRISLKNPNGENQREGLEYFMSLVPGILEEYSLNNLVITLSK